MKIQEILDNTPFHKLLEGSSPSIPAKIVAYHGGTGFKGHFDLKFSGTGEGYRILGPGLYCTTDKAQAAVYAKKYAKSNPTVYSLIIDTNNFYDNMQYPTPKMEQTVEAIAKELGYTWDTLPRNHETLHNGRGAIGEIVRAAGHMKALGLFQKYGLNGAVEHLPGDVWEISVFNLDHVKVTDTESIEKEPAEGESLV